MATTPSRDGRPLFSRIPTESIRSVNDQHLALMRASVLFAGLIPRECTEILRCARARTYARNEILFRQGNPAEGVVLIQSGSVKLTQLSAQGDEVILWMTGSGDALGAHASTMPYNHTCSARAMEQCEALVWEYTRLRSLMVQYPQIGANIGRILDVKLRELEVRFREIATDNVVKHVASTLFRLLNPIGKKTPAGEVELNLSRKDLAQMTGLSMFTISRILSRWAEEGFVVPKHQAVIIRDTKRLQAVSKEEYSTPLRPRSV